MKEGSSKGCKRILSNSRKFGMSEQLGLETMTREELARIEQHVQCRLTGQMCDFRLVLDDQGLILRGRTHTYYAKQLAQQAVMEATNLSIRANEIEVS